MPARTPDEPTRRGRGRAVLDRVRAGGRFAFCAVVRRSDDRRLERTFGSDRGLRLLFGAMARRFDPEAAGGFSGAITYELLGMDGATRTWTIEVDGRRAGAVRGRPGAPALVVRLGLADVVRVAAGDLDAGEALLTGRLDLEGDAAVAMRLGAMFGTDSGLGPGQ